jgi:hypothetical protein
VGGAAALVRRFATIGVSQRGGSSSRKPDYRPASYRVADFDRRANHAGGDELVEAARPSLRRHARRNQLGDDPAMNGDGNALPCLNPPDSDLCCL